MPVTIDGSNTPTAGGIAYGDGTEIVFTTSLNGFVKGNGSSFSAQSISSTDVTFQSQVISTNTSAVAGTYYTLTASLTLTLPATPTAGQFVAFSNRSGTTTAVIGRNGSNIMGSAEDLTLDTTAARGTLVYTDATRGWVLFND